jgi:hypothetical protein
VCAEQQTNLNDGLHSAIDMLLRVLAVSKCVTANPFPSARARCARATGERHSSDLWMR